MVFLGGVFFGGAVDHVVLALSGRVDTPYGVRVGVGGNWAMAALDAVLTLGCWLAHRRLKGRVSRRT